MAPTPSDLTDRILIKYTSDGLPHVMQLRFRDFSDPADVLAKVNSIAAAMKVVMWTGDAISGALRIPTGSNISVPYPITETGPGASTVTVHDDFSKTAFISVTGKDNTGVDVRTTFFSPGAYGFVDTRIAIGVLATNWTDLWTAITDLTDEAVVTAAGIIPFWNAYVNIGRNSHFQRKSR